MHVPATQIILATVTATASIGIVVIEIEIEIVTDVVIQFIFKSQLVLFLSDFQSTKRTADEFNECSCGFRQDLEHDRAIVANRPDEFVHAQTN